MEIDCQLSISDNFLPYVIKPEIRREQIKLIDFVTKKHKAPAAQQRMRSMHSTFLR